MGTPALGDYQYVPTGGAWSYTWGGGLAGPGSAFGNPAAPEGQQVAFVQDTGTVSQALSGFQAGTEYTLTVSAAQRDYGGTNQQTVAVKLDGTTVGTITPSGDGFQDYTVGPFTASAGAHTLTFAGLDPPGGDNTTFLDAVRLGAATAAPSYGYNGDGLRAWKSVNGGPRTYFLYDGDTPLCQTDASGNVTAVQTFGADGLALQRTISGGAGTSYDYTWDPSGDVAQRFSPTGGNASYAFDGFGLRGVSQTADPFSGFGGQWGGYTDPETGLALFTHRYYDAGTGRWLTRDPIGYTGGIGLYAYCTNDPVNSIDSLGHAPFRLPRLPHIPLPWIAYYSCITIWVKNPKCHFRGGGACITQCYLYKKILGNPPPMITTTVNCVPLSQCATTGKNVPQPISLKHGLS